MKYAKMLGLLALAAAALMAWMGVGTASATTLECEGAPCAQNTVIHSVVEGTAVLHPPIGDIECSESTVEGKLEKVGGATETPGGNIGTLTFGKCNAEVVVLKAGSLEIHTEEATKEAVSENNGTLTSTGAEVTVTFLGFHCIFGTNGTDIGTVTGSANTGGNATLDITATIPRTGGRSGAFCGSTAKWTGSYKVDSPKSANTI